jgi:hypothetical protein
MKIKLLKILDIICLIGCVAWYYKNPDWEPFITGLGLLAAFIGLEWNESKEIEKNPDIILYKKLIDLLPSATIIEYLRNKDFGSAFRNEQIDPLREFCAYYDNAEHEFIDSKLESKKKELLNSANEFLNYLARHTWPLQDGIQSIPAEWQEDQRERWDRTKRELNRLSDLVVIKHQELVRLCKSKLNV